MKDTYSYIWKKWKKYRIDWSPDIKRLGLNKDDVIGKTVLDVGCGVGMDIADYLKAKKVVGIDNSSGIEIAMERYKNNSNVFLYQTKIDDFKPDEKFDIVCSNGVLHHTPNTHEYFKKIAKFVKKGGSLSVFLYNKHYTVNQRIASWRRIISKLHPRVIIILCYLIPFIPIIPCCRKSWHKKFNYLEMVLANFDWYMPKYRNLHTYPEVYGWFKEEGFTNIELYDPPVSMKGYV